MIHHRFATAADIDRYYGERPAETLQAIVILMDEEPVAIIGLAREGDRYRAFSEYRPELEPHLRTMPVLRAIKAGQKMVNDAPLPVVALADGKPGFLARLGFNEIQPGVYLWPN
jgi:hypothetical protein